MARVRALTITCDYARGHTSIRFPVETLLDERNARIAAQAAGWTVNMPTLRRRRHPDRDLCPAHTPKEQP